MSLPRVDINTIILPTGTILATGGSALKNDVSTASRAADLFDPETETWTSAGVAAYPRLYHSVGVLLPDAAVWTAGSNPQRGTYEEHMEIYAPAYLFTRNTSGQVVPAVRPTITDVPETSIGYGQAFAVQTPDAANIQSIALIRPAATTHAFDMEQRMVRLDFVVSKAGTLTVISPPMSSIAPPGYYMLFLVNDKGVPSIAEFVQLTLNDTSPPPPPDHTKARPRTRLEQRDSPDSTPPAARRRSNSRDR
jgi:hypothetical protein